MKLILEKLAGGASVEWILDSYPHLKKEDVLEAIKYAHSVLTNEEIIESASI